MDGDGRMDPLVAACDVLVVGALERLGSRIIRSDRSRWSRMDGRRRHEAHTLWQPEAGQVSKALEDVWWHLDRIVAVHGCCGITAGQVQAVLDRYVADLIETMAGHDEAELRLRFTAYLAPVASHAG